MKKYKISRCICKNSNTIQYKFENIKKYPSLDFLSLIQY